MSLIFHYVELRGNTIKLHAWGLRRLITEFSRAAKRPHIPREPAMRELYIQAGVPLPEGSPLSHSLVCIYRSISIASAYLMNSCSWVSAFHCLYFKNPSQTIP